jgi:hypothetical protein
MKTSSAKTRKWLSGLMALFLCGCAGSNVKDAPPATDLLIFKAGVLALTQKREVAGDYRRLEDVPTTGESYQYAGNLEDLAFLDCTDKSLVREFVSTGLAAIESGRQVRCSWWNFACRSRQRNTPLQQGQKNVEDVRLDCRAPSMIVQPPADRAILARDRSVNPSTTRP